MAVEQRSIGKWLHRLVDFGRRIARARRTRGPWLAAPPAMMINTTSVQP